MTDDPKKMLHEMAIWLESLSDEQRQAVAKFIEPDLIEKALERLELILELQKDVPRHRQ